MESNKLARNTVRTKWYGEKKNEPVDNTVHIRDTTGYWLITECDKHSANMDKHSVNFLPSATLGKHDSVNNDSVKLVYRVSTNGALGE